MAGPRNPSIAVTIVFLAILAVPGTVQFGIEAGRRERPRALDVFTIKPTALNLHAYEKALEDTSWVAAHLRPWMQYVHFLILHDGGEKALIGRDGWFFYKPGVEYLTRRPPVRERTGHATDPLPAMVGFRDQLAARGIRLLLLPMPNKESIYPEKLSKRATHLESVVCPQTRSLLERTRSAGIEAIDLFSLFAEAKGTKGTPSERPLYLAQDSHWSPTGVRLTARAVADWLVLRGWVRPGQTGYTPTPAPVERLGDVLRMLQSPPIERRISPETVQCTQVMGADGNPYRDNSNAEILVLGDSFLRIYERDEPGSAGFNAHLALELKQPVASIVNDGGASTLVRQELFRRPALLAHKKVVIWEFVERDIRFGTEGWQLVPLPPGISGAEQAVPKLTSTQVLD